MGGQESSNFNSGDPEKRVLRFDARMLFHFDCLVRLYCNLRRMFPSVIV